MAIVYSDGDMKLTLATLERKEKAGIKKEEKKDQEPEVKSGKKTHKKKTKKPS